MEVSMIVKERSLKLAVLALQDDIPELNEESLAKVLAESQTDKKVPELPKIIRRKDLVKILGISLRNIDRLLAPTKKNGKISIPPKLKSIQLSSRSIGVLESDLLAFIKKNRR